MDFTMPTPTVLGKHMALPFLEAGIARDRLGTALCQAYVGFEILVDMASMKRNMLERFTFFFLFFFYNIRNGWIPYFQLSPSKNFLWWLSKHHSHVKYFEFLITCSGLG